MERREFSSSEHEGRGPCIVHHAPAFARLPWDPGVDECSCRAALGPFACICSRAPQHHATESQAGNPRAAAKTRLERPFTYPLFPSSNAHTFTHPPIRPWQVCGWLWRPGRQSRERQPCSVDGRMLVAVVSTKRPFGFFLPSSSFVFTVAPFMVPHVYTFSYSKTRRRRTKF